MVALTKLLDTILFLFFLFVAFAAPLIDTQIIFPSHLYPTSLVDLVDAYVKDYGDYLFSEKPHFCVGIIWLELFFQWPLALASLYGIVASKSWLNTTCLMYGVSTFSTMVVIFAEFTRSGRASDTLLMMYYPYLGCAALAMLRGQLPHSDKIPTLNTKKKD